MAWGVEEKTEDLAQFHHLESDNIRCVVVLECGNGGGDSVGSGGGGDGSGGTGSDEEGSWRGGGGGGEVGVEEKTQDLTKAVTQLHNLESDNIRCVVVLLLECGDGGGGGDEEKRGRGG